jgi:sugar phosphate isomerase/epimerase
MSRLRIAVSTSRLTSRLRDVPQAAAATGATGVQFDARNQLRPGDLSETGRRQLLYELGERRLGVASLSFPLRRTLADPEHLDARVSALKEAMQFAWDLKARCLVCRAGRIPEPADSPEFARLHEVLRDLARHGNRVGVTLAFTPSGESGAELARLVDSISDGPLGVNFDPAERIMNRRDPVTSLRELHRHVAHLTIRDAVRDLDLGGREVPVGRGEADWDSLLAALDEMNYLGWATIDRTAGDDPLGDIARAVSFLTNLGAS